MIDFKKYFQAPLENIEVGKDNQLKFFNDALNRLIKNVDNGAPFADLISPTEAAYINLRDNLTDTAVSFNLQQSKTVSVDSILESFKKTISKREAAIRVHFDKPTPEYQEFFPHGLTQYTKITKATATVLFHQLVVAAQNHVSKVGQPMVDEFIKFEDDYTKARNMQTQEKGATDDKRTVWDINLDTMKDQTHYNALTIAREYRKQPEKCKAYYDLSILKLKKSNSNNLDAQPQTEQIAPLATLTPVMNFTATDTILLSNVSDAASIFWYGGDTINEAPKTAPTELLAGEEIEIPATTLGKYLILLNKDTVNTAEVELMLV